MEVLAAVSESIMNHVRDGQRRRYWIVGGDYSDSEKEWRVLWAAAKQLGFPLDTGSRYNVLSGDLRMSLLDGVVVVEGKSAHHPESLDGEGLDGVVMTEAAKMRPNIWSKFIRPALADRNGWSLHTSTPEGRNHFYELWMKGQDPADPEWDSWRMPSWANDVVFPGGRHDPEIEAMHSDLSEERFRQEVEADFSEFAGRVFPQFSEETHVRTLPYDPRLPLVAAVDYGFTNPFVWLLIQVDVWDTVRIVGEWRATGMTVPDIAGELRSWREGLSTRCERFYPDPSSPGDSSTLSRLLRVRSSSNTGGDLKDRLELIRRWLKPVPEHLPDGHPEKQSKLLIDRSCVELIEEMGVYRYPERRSELQGAPENPLKVDDHGPEALGRFFKGYFGAGRGTSRVSRANLHR